MTLLSLTRHPPGGFSYREARTGWVVPDKKQPFEDIAWMILAQRQHNPTLFTPHERTIEDCRKALDQFTCDRLGCAPKWCACASSRAKPVKEPSKGCATCGGRKKRG